MFGGTHYQNAYITRDIAAAADHLCFDGSGLNFKIFDVTYDVTTPKGPGQATSKLGFAWIGDMQYELIEPVSGMVDIYSDALPADNSLQFHHAAFRVADWDALRQQVSRSGLAVVFEGGGDALKFLYVDARGLLGHHLEYVWATDERWAQVRGI